MLRFAQSGAISIHVDAEDGEEVDERCLERFVSCRNESERCKVVPELAKLEVALRCASFADRLFEHIPEEERGVLLLDLCRARDKHGAGILHQGRLDRSGGLVVVVVGAVALLSYHC